MNNIIKKTGGDINLIEKALAIPSGNWSSQKMSRVDITKDKIKNLRMPTGAEQSANEFFTPGGFTAGGIKEAVIDPIPKGNYTHKPINF